ncbi:MAG TPA: hypothetical protein VK421_06700 [Pyrinomonadaceae bacterium]|nr:hypothetical protein [Pyrinomonadaceae bacterium]
MKVNTYGTARACALGLCALLCVAAPAAGRQQQQQPAPPPPPKVSSEAELKAAQAVEKAADAAAALAAAGEFVKKYPKSEIRLEVARLVADKIAKAPDAAQRVTLSEGFLKTFNAPAEANVINPDLAIAYVNAKRLDDAFRVADPAAAANFERPMDMLITLTMTGADELQRGNAKYRDQSRQLGLKAAEMFEADRMPAGTDAARWAAHKAEWLPKIYHSLAVMSYVSGDKADARAMLEKAVALNTTEAVSYYLLGRIADEEYQELAKQHRGATGAAQDELHKQALARMDKAIDAYARAIALAEGDARYEQLRTGLRPTLEDFYKYRNNNSTEGLQALIDKYKKPAAAKP